MSHEKTPDHDHDIGCLEAIEGLYAWLDGELDDAATVAHIEAHIRHCQSCYSRAEVERLLNEKLRNSEPEEQAPERLRQRLDSLMKRF